MQKNEWYNTSNFIFRKYPKMALWHFIQYHFRTKNIKTYFVEITFARFPTCNLWEIKLFTYSISKYLLSQSCILVCSHFLAFIPFMYSISCKLAQDRFFLKKKNTINPLLFYFTKFCWDMNSFYACIFKT